MLRRLLTRYGARCARRVVKESRAQHTGKSLKENHTSTSLDVRVRGWNRNRPPEAAREANAAAIADAIRGALRAQGGERITSSAHRQVSQGEPYFDLPRCAGERLESESTPRGRQRGECCGDC